MKITGIKYNLLLITISLVLIMADIFLMINYGFDGQLLIFLYVMIGVVPLGSIIALITGMCSPTIIIDNYAKCINASFIANEQYKNSHNPRHSFTSIYFDEIIDCANEKHKLIIIMKYNQTKTLFLNFFTKKQIIKIKNEINKNIK